MAFGSDEEVNGEGALAIANALHSRGVQLELVIDEGGPITVGMLPFMKPVAMVGIAEKGKH